MPILDKDVRLIPEQREHDRFVGLSAIPGVIGCRLFNSGEIVCPNVSGQHDFHIAAYHTAESWAVAFNHMATVSTR